MIMESEFENNYVHKTYDKIAQKFSITRHTVWKYTKKFINSLPKNSKCLEIGCGNGKNMLYCKDLDWTGVEICKGFRDICIKRGLNVIDGNAIDLPFEDNSFDVVISIAVIHHLSTEQRRKKAIQEMFRVLKPGGRMLIEVWSIKQLEKSTHKFSKQENMVPWKLISNSATEIHNRYYHVFVENELKDLIVSVANTTTIKNMEIIWEMGNDIADIEC